MKEFSLKQILVARRDYGFFVQDQRTAKEYVTLRCPVLAVKCKWACPVPEKGSWTWAATVVLKNLELLGYWKVFLKSDQEKSSKALAQAVKNARSAEIILESSLVADSQGNGKRGARCWESLPARLWTRGSHVSRGSSNMLEGS